MNIITRQEAIQKGLKTYFTGKPCKNGHISERMICCICIMCHQESGKKYRSNNKEKIKQYFKQNGKKYYSTEKRRKKYIDNVELELFHHAKHRAKTKRLEFNLTKEDIIIPNTCPIFGVPLNFENKNNVPTLDRIDSNKGYIKGNIQVISFKANRLKNNGSIEEFKKIINYMETHQKIGLKNG